MSCTTIDRHGDADSRLRGCAGGPRPGCRNARLRRLGRLASSLGEQLFHYRYVRAEMIERALDRRHPDDGDRS